LCQWFFAVRKKNYIDVLKPIAYELGYPKMFSGIDREKIGIDNTIWCCNFYNKNNRFPSNTSKNAEERIKAAWLSGQKLAYKSPNKIYGEIKFRQKNLEKAIEMGVPNLFICKEEKLKAQGIQYTIWCCNFHKKYGRYPSQYSTNPEERKLANWLDRQKLVYKSPNKIHKGIKFRLENELKSIELGYPNLFKQIDREEVFKNNCKDVIEFVKINKRKPLEESTNKKESFLGRFLSRIRRNYKLKNKNQYFGLYPSALDLFKKEKMMYLLED
jgi:hypothetical protein